MATLHADRHTVLMCRAQSVSELEMSQTKAVKTTKTHILCSVTFFSENRAVYEIVWKIWYSRTGHR